MKIVYSVRHKGKIAVLLLVIVLLEIFCSQTYSSNISQISESFSEVYSDRIIAQDYIYKMAAILHRRKPKPSDEPGERFKKELIFNDHGLKISLLMAKYEKTKLTSDEKITFNHFKNNILLLIALEKRHGKETDHRVNEKLNQSHDKLLYKSLAQLDKLSEIQISRVKDLNEASQKTVSFSSLLNQFDWALLIVIGLTIQVLIFASRSTRPSHLQNHFLN